MSRRPTTDTPDGGDRDNTLQPSVRGKPDGDTRTIADNIPPVSTASRDLSTADEHHGGEIDQPGQKPTSPCSVLLLTQSQPNARKRPTTPSAEKTGDEPTETDGRATGQGRRQSGRHRGHRGVGTPPRSRGATPFGRGTADLLRHAFSRTGEDGRRRTDTASTYRERPRTTEDARRDERPTTDRNSRKAASARHAARRRRDRRQPFDRNAAADRPDRPGARSRRQPPTFAGRGRAEPFENRRQIDRNGRAVRAGRSRPGDTPTETAVGNRNNGDRPRSRPDRPQHPKPTPASRRETFAAVVACNRRQPGRGRPVRRPQARQPFAESARTDRNRHGRQKRRQPTARVATADPFAP